MLSIRSLDQYYGESHTLWGVDLEVVEGSCTCLMGRNGVGKTTLLKALMGLVPSTSKRLSLAELELGHLSADRRARHGVGYVPQGREIFPQLTVEENLRIGFLAGPHANRSARERKSAELFELFPVLGEMLLRRGGDLSGGQQQQLAIARALASEPRLLVLDEPTEGIQPNVIQHIADVLLQLKAKGLTVLLVEQKLPFARRVGEHFTILDRGRNVSSGTMVELTDELVTRHLVV